jgi:radical SAM-linked protein
MQRIRLYYAKTEAMRYTGNLDVHKVWERTLRRARLPLAYSQGFHPQPRLNQASPLPLGLTSHVEMIDFWLDPDQDLVEVENAIRGATPPGISVNHLELADLRAPALQTQVTASDYLALVLDPPPADLEERIKNLLAASSLPRTRRDKSYDLRPLVLELELRGVDEAGRAMLFMKLMAREGQTGRTDEVLDALGLDQNAARVERIALYYLPAAA